MKKKTWAICSNRSFGFFNQSRTEDTHTQKTHPKQNKRKKKPQTQTAELLLLFFLPMLHILMFNLLAITGSRVDIKRPKREDCFPPRANDPCLNSGLRFFGDLRWDKTPPAAKYLGRFLLDSPLPRLPVGGSGDRTPRHIHLIPVCLSSLVPKKLFSRLLLFAIIIGFGPSPV